MDHATDARAVVPASAPPSAGGAGWGVAELHCHTTASDGICTPERLVEIADDLSLDVLAVTDHDTLDGARRARAFAQASGARVDVVLGMEVTTRRQDHIVGLYLEDPVPIFRSVPNTVDAIHAQGGLAIVAHPFLGLPSSISPRRLRRALESIRFDGIEVENQYMRAKTRARVRDFAAGRRADVGADIGATDAHFGDLARAVTLFEGRTAADLRAAITARATVALPGSIQHPRPGVWDHARNQYRSLLKLPVMRVRLLVGQLRGR